MGLVFALTLLIAFLAIGYADLMQTLGAEPLFKSHTPQKGSRTLVSTRPAVAGPENVPALQAPEPARVDGAAADASDAAAMTVQNERREPGA